jgi:hypothetical protein
MANTRIQKEAEGWIRSTYLRRVFRREFRQAQVRLSSGGTFEFDAVSADGAIVAVISTSRARTASGGYGSGKLHKIRADVLFLLLARARRRIAVFTEADMFDEVSGEAARGRLPRSIELRLARLPPSLARRVARARRASSREVSPPKSAHLRAPED